MTSRALITGISGQDGSYLAELLLDKGYEVVGSIRRKSDQENELGHAAHLDNDVQFEYMDVTDSASVQRVIKLFAHNIMTNYRESYDMFASNGNLFNHESPRRGKGFVTQKIVYGAVEIALGVRDGLELGNLSPQRDWGHARDYVDAMWRMMQQDEPGDFVIATGKAHTIDYLVDYVFEKVGLDREEYVTINEAFVRPNELDILIGDATKAKEVLGWTPTYTFEEMLSEMIDTARRELMIKGFRS